MRSARMPFLKDSAAQTADQIGYEWLCTSDGHRLWRRWLEHTPRGVSHPALSRRLLAGRVSRLQIFRTVPASKFAHPQIVPTAAHTAARRGFYVRAYRASLPPHAPDMLTVRIQAIDGTRTFTLSDSQPCRLLTFLRRHYPASSVIWPLRLPDWPPPSLATFGAATPSQSRASLTNPGHLPASCSLPRWTGSGARWLASGAVPRRFLPCPCCLPRYRGARARPRSPWTGHRVVTGPTLAGCGKRVF